MIKAENSPKIPKIPEIFLKNRKISRKIQTNIIINYYNNELGILKVGVL